MFLDTQTPEDEHRRKRIPEIEEDRSTIRSKESINHRNNRIDKRVGDGIGSTQMDEQLLYIEECQVNSKYNPNKHTRRGGRMQGLKSQIKMETMSKQDKIAKTSNYEKNRTEGQKITKTNG